MNLKHWPSQTAPTPPSRSGLDESDSAAARDCAHSIKTIFTNSSRLLCLRMDLSLDSGWAPAKASLVQAVLCRFQQTKAFFFTF